MSTFLHSSKGKCLLSCIEGTRYASSELPTGNLLVWFVVCFFCFLLFYNNNFASCCCHYYNFVAVDKEFIPVDPESTSGHVHVNGTSISFTTTITNGAGRTLNSHGIFRCQACSLDCLHSDITLYVVGAPPIINSGKKSAGKILY